MNGPVEPGGSGMFGVRPIIPRPNPGRALMTTIRQQAAAGHAPQLQIHQLVQHAGALKALQGVLANLSGGYGPGGMTDIGTNYHMGGDPGLAGVASSPLQTLAAQIHSSTGGGQMDPAIFRQMSHAQPAQMQGHQIDPAILAHLQSMLRPGAGAIGGAPIDDGNVYGHGMVG